MPETAGSRSGCGVSSSSGSGSGRSTPCSSNSRTGPPALSRNSSASTTASASSPRQSLGHRIESEFELSSHVLGTGASGDVRQATCRRTGRKVAVKSFRISKLSPKQRGNLTREAAVHSCVSHPNIAKLEAVYESEEDVHLVLERIAGGELFERMAAVERLGESSAARVCAQVLRAAAYLHARHIVHRDIKPENILFEEKDGDALKLIDFGFACFLDSKEARQQMCGTVQYVAPEVLQRKGFDTKSDVWSVGTVLYTSLTGRVLYGGEPSTVLAKNKAGNIDFARSFFTLSPECQSFVRRLLTVNPEKRPSAAEALEDPWLRRHAKTTVELALAEIRADFGCLPEALREMPVIQLRLAPQVLAGSPMQRPAPAPAAASSPQKAEKFPGIISMLLPYFVGGCAQTEKREPSRTGRSSWSLLPNLVGFFKDLALCAHADERRS